MGMARGGRFQRAVPQEHVQRDTVCRCTRKGGLEGVEYEAAKALKATPLPSTIGSSEDLFSTADEVKYIDEKLLHRSPICNRSHVFFLLPHLFFHPELVSMCREF